MHHTPSDKTIYLTFDDGIEPGTQEVLNVLEENNTAATFFLTGIHTRYSCDKDRADTLDILNRIRQHHALGNHSYTHCYGCYQEYYQQGLLTDDRGTRLSVTSDFQQQDHFIHRLTEDIYPFITAVPRLARLPAKNAWQLSAPPFRKTERGAEAAAGSLFQAGYEVFGWDDEWKMSFDFAQDIKQRKEEVMAAITGYPDYTRLYPWFDMLAPEHIHKDRLTEPWMDVFKRILLHPKQHFVLLMHDRAFRQHPAYQAADQLHLLIRFLKSAGIRFRTLADYMKPLRNGSV
ncbi:polysaccharide deacetylase family protein [Chitinophaga solisilvae]|uniref:polysaccharide deacetylase family protein n=1 Tax=Chitinophaga solisilvae TaxID=1233460 RepID=UPI00136C260D|nr:polysaccharide deacetylase family protein [Chitinophaga solisilvae]